jgi:hypothetical protein
MSKGVKNKKQEARSKQQEASNKKGRIKRQATRSKQ